MKTIEEQIEVIKHFGDGGEVEIFTNGKWNLVINRDFANWNFGLYDYRIKEQKKTVAIEKWLVERDGDITAIEGNEDGLLSWSGWNKIKLLETYEVEL